VAITTDGTLVAGLPDGLSRTNRGDWCEWSRPAGFASEPVTDVSSTGSTVMAAVTPPASMQYVTRSEDHGATWTRGWTRPEFYAHTIDVAPSRPSRVYATGWVRGARPALFRSDDRGADFVEVTRDFSGGYIAFLAWVDPLDHDALLVRADLDPSGALLLRSNDGGATFRTLLRATAPLVGVAATPGGGTLWASSTALNERIQRSADRGGTWASVASTLRPRSLRYANGLLYATANETTSGMSFACSRDEGDTWTPMLVLSDLRGPEACPVGSVVRTTCAPQWDALRAQLAMIPRPTVGPRGTCEANPNEDGGVGDAGAPDSAAERDAGATIDASTDDSAPSRDASGPTTDVGAPRATGGCSCRAAGGSNESAGRVLSLVAAAWAAALARSKGREKRRRPEDSQ
jgi:hypothetical protein